MDKEVTILFIHYIIKKETRKGLFHSYSVFMKLNQ